MADDVLSTPTPWAELLGYWRAAQPDGAAAGRPVDPLKDLPEIAAKLTIIDVTVKPYRYLSFSPEVGRKLGMDLTGKNAGSSALIETVKLEWNRLLESVTRLRTPRLVEIVGDQETLHYILALPVLGPNGRTQQIILGTFFDPRPVTKIMIRKWRRIDL